RHVANMTPILTTHEADADGALLHIVRPLYAEVYAEAPYLEGAAEVANFAEQWWPRCVHEPGFRLVVARVDGAPVGFSFGHRLRADSDWWGGPLDPLPAEVHHAWGWRPLVL